jgi:hypothetical protein
MISPRRAMEQHAAPANWHWPVSQTSASPLVIARLDRAIQ